MAFFGEKTIIAIYAVYVLLFVGDKSQMRGLHAYTYFIYQSNDMYMCIYIILLLRYVCRHVHMLAEEQVHEEYDKRFLKIKYTLKD